jgi:acyl carrier protein
MNESELEQDFLSASAEALGVAADAVSLQTKRGDIAEWDSLAQIVLFLAIEDRFRTKFSTTQIQELDKLELIFAEVRSQVAS